MADNSFLEAWKQQLDDDGAYDVGALAEALAFERDRAETWRATVVSSVAAYEGTRKLLKSYDEQLALNLQRFAKSSSPESSFSAILECVVYAKSLIASKTKEQLEISNLKLTAALAAVESDEFQRMMVAKKEEELGEERE